MIMYILLFILICAVLAGIAERVPAKEEYHKLCNCNCGRQATGELTGKPICRACAKQYFNAQKILQRSMPDWPGPLGSLEPGADGGKKEAPAELQLHKAQ